MNPQTLKFRKELFDKAAELAMQHGDYSGLTRIIHANEPMFQGGEGLQIQATEWIIRGVKAYIKWIKFEREEIFMTEEALLSLESDYLKFREAFFGEKEAPN